MASLERALRRDSRQTDAQETVCGQLAIDFDGEKISGEGRGPAEGHERGRRVQRDGLQFPSYKPLAMSPAFLRGKGAERSHAICHDCVRDRRLGMKRPCARPGPRRKGKQMEVAEGQIAHEVEGLREFGVCFAGKADHNVGSDGEVRAGGAEQRFDFLDVVPGPVTAEHAAEHGVRA